MSESNCVVHRITTKSNKRRRGHDGFEVSTSTVPCHEHFLVEDITKKTLWSLAFEEWLWDFSAFVMPLLCLRDNSAVCVSAFGYLKLQKPKIFSVFINQSSYIISDHRLCKWVLDFLAEVFYLRVILHFLYKVAIVWVFDHGIFLK